MNSLIFAAPAPAILFLLLLLCQLHASDAGTVGTRVNASANWQSPGSNYLEDMLVEYFRFQGVHSLLLVVCDHDIATYAARRRLNALVNHFNDNNFFVEITNEATFTDLSMSTEKLPNAFEPPKTFFADNETRFELSFTLPPHYEKLGILMLHINSKCALNLLRWSAATEHNFFTTSRFWVLLTEDHTDFHLLEDEQIFLPPDSEVRVLTHLQTSPTNVFSLLDVYKVAITHPLRHKFIGGKLHNVRQLTRALMRFGSAITYRQNLEGIEFRTGIVIAFPDVFTNIEDLSLRHIDTISKVNHRLMLEMANRFNITYNTYQTDNYGWLMPNGSFSGLMGRFQRYELDFAQLAIFMRVERLQICDFVAETYRIRAGIMFRQPPLSAVANIFAMPFKLDVWLSILALIIITAVVLSLELFFSPHAFDMAYLDTIIFVWGAMCQQGFYVEMGNRSGRVIVFTTFVATLFLFTSFSANIVALLQSPSDAISTIDDLSQSPLEVGVQDTQYNKIYFTESTDPVTNNLYRKKIAIKGDHIYMRPALGMEKMRTGLFAYQVELQAGYQIVSDTFNEPEKCGLMELEPFQLPMIAIPTRKNFPYKELFRRQLRWQREVGLVNREANKWFPQKPKCEGGVGGFDSIGVTECRYALGICACGALISFVVFLGELLFKHHAALYRAVHGFTSMHFGKRRHGRHNLRLGHHKC